MKFQTRANTMNTNIIISLCRYANEHSGIGNTDLSDAKFASVTRSLDVKFIGNI